jgi:hypothetical protein
VGTFAADTAYTATISLSVKAGYTFDGVPADFFTVLGATAANTANSGTVTAVFPRTAPLQADFNSAVDETTAADVPTLGLVGATAVSGAPAVAAAEITGGKVKITSTGAGTAVITVSDAANHSAAIQVTVTATGAISIGAITKYESTNPLLGIWRQGPLNNLDELVVFTEGVAYYAPFLTKQTNMDKANYIINLAVPSVNNGASQRYSWRLDGDKNLVIVNSYFTDNRGDPMDFTFTRIEGSVKTDVEDVWYSKGRIDALHTLLVIMPNGTVYTSFGMTDNDWNFDDDGDWVRASYELMNVTPAGGTIRWTDGSDEFYVYTIDGNELTINRMHDDPYIKQNL